MNWLLRFLFCYEFHWRRPAPPVVEAYPPVDVDEALADIRAASPDTVRWTDTHSISRQQPPNK